MDTSLTDRFPHKRQRRMIDVIFERTRISTSELATFLGVSLPTVRRDLAVLEQAGVVARTHGGVIALGEGENGAEPLFLEKLRQGQALKQRIGQAAAERLKDGQVCLIDSGTTALATARALAGRQLTVITMDLKVAEAASVGNTEVHIVGGRIRNGYFSLVGPWAKEALKGIRADICFLTADAIDEDGISTTTFDEAEIKRLAMSRSKLSIAIVDHTKFGKRAFAEVCDLNAVDELITDSHEEHKASLYQTHVPALTFV